MKFAAAILALAGPAAAFAPIASIKKSTATTAFTAEELPGVLAPVGFFNLLGFAEKADENIMKQYRDADLTDGHVAMLTNVAFFAGERVGGSSFLFDSQITGPAISHLAQVPPPAVSFWIILIVAIGATEQYRATVGWIKPENVPVAKPGLLRADYLPGGIGFDPLGLKPLDPEELKILQTKELQNGRLAMLAAVGFMAQELVDGKGILERFSA
jgi:hypothetical protein